MTTHLELGRMDALIVAAVAESEQEGQAHVTDAGEVVLGKLEDPSPPLTWAELRNLREIKDEMELAPLVDGLYETYDRDSAAGRWLSKHPDAWFIEEEE